MQRMKETQNHSKTLYEKEVRRARKEAFKSSSALVNLQEELKTTRNRYTLMREDVEVQKRKVELREQETFSAQYQLVGVQEELEEQKRQMKLVEEERDMLKTNLKEEEVARIAAEGKIPLPIQAGNDEFSSPKKQRPEIRRESGKENWDPMFFEDYDQLDELGRLKEDLRAERNLRVRADDLVEFMRMECQFKVCSCRIAERTGSSYVHDNRFEARMQEIAKGMGDYRPTKPKNPTITAPAIETSDSIASPEREEREDTEPLIEFSPTTGTFRTIQSPSRIPSTLSPPPPSRLFSTELASLAVPLAATTLSESPSLLSLTETNPKPESAPRTHTPPPISIPATPRALPCRPISGAATINGPSRIISNTITTTIPLADPFSPTKDMPFSPGASMTKEQALEQIRQRRGRARSIAAGNGTPRKPMVDIRGLRRDISAPAAGTNGM